MNQKGISLVALVITIIVIILLAAITMVSSTRSVDQATEVKFKNDLTEVVTALDVYHEQANIYGIPSYDRDDLSWDGTSERAENTAMIEDKTKEDKIKFILTADVPDSLKGKMTIENGRVKIDKSYTYEYEWAVEKYSYMEY